jgi:hypothetical protein
VKNAPKQPTKGGDFKWQKADPKAAKISPNRANEKKAIAD